MKALALASGPGSRPRPATDGSAGQPRPVGHEAMPFYGLEVIRDGMASEDRVVAGDMADAMSAVVGGVCLSAGRMTRSGR